jgi:hypothetical protein
MTTTIQANLIKATALTKGQETDMWYALHKALNVLCAKLDADSTVNDTDYEALCWAAIINALFMNTTGDSVQSHVAGEGFWAIRPAMITNRTRSWIMYNWVKAWKTLCTKLDADSAVSGTDYVATCYTAKILHIVMDPKGVTDLGNGVVYYFTPGNVDRKQLIEFFYNALDALHTLAAKLDSDGGVADTDYDDLTYTAYCLINVENAAGSVIGAG